jgi:hypothetical protein
MPANALGNWFYEAIDTKLARETKAGTILQLCLYSDLLAEAQGLSPEYMYVVAPWSEFEPQQYRFGDYAAYFRKVKHALQMAMGNPAEETYPDPVEYCEICRWREVGDKRRCDDDHLCLVAGLQINELQQRGIATVRGLANMPLPLEWKPNHGSGLGYKQKFSSQRGAPQPTFAETRSFHSADGRPIDPRLRLGQDGTPRGSPLTRRGRRFGFDRDAVCRLVYSRLSA